MKIWKKPGQTNAFTLVPNASAILLSQIGHDFNLVFLKFSGKMAAE
jgi:hypothetical protein